MRTEISIRTLPKRFALADSRLSQNLSQHLIQDSVAFDTMIPRIRTGSRVRADDNLLMAEGLASFTLKGQNFDETGSIAR